MIKKILKEVTLTLIIAVFLSITVVFMASTPYMPSLQNPDQYEVFYIQNTQVTLDTVSTYTPLPGGCIILDTTDTICANYIRVLPLYID